MGDQPLVNLLKKRIILAARQCGKSLVLNSAQEKLMEYLKKNPGAKLAILPAPLHIQEQEMLEYLALHGAIFDKSRHEDAYCNPSPPPKFDLAGVDLGPVTITEYAKW
jgi:hypothetical protein